MEAQQHTLAAFDAVPVSLAVLDANGVIIAVNTTWRQATLRYAPTEESFGVGVALKQLCRRAHITDSHTQTIVAGIESIAAGEQTVFVTECAQTHLYAHWFFVRAVLFTGYPAARVLLTIEDITKRKYERAVSGETMQRLHSFINILPDMVLLLDTTGRYLDMNQAATVVTGYSREELLHMTPHDLTPTVDRRIRGRSLEQFNANGVWRGEYPILCKDGRVLMVDMESIANLYPGVHISISRDSAARKRYMVLEQSAAQLRMIYDMHQAMLSARSLNEVAETILQFFRHFFPDYTESLLIYDFDTYTAQVITRVPNTSGERYMRDQFALDQFSETEPILELYRQGGHFVFDIRALSYRSPNMDALIAEGQPYFLCVPINSQGELFGVLQFAMAAQDEVDPQHTMLFQNMAESIAVAIRHARLFEAVHTGREHMRALAQQLVSLQETERRRIANNLHDQVGQNLSVMTMSITAAQSQLAADASPQVGRLLETTLRTIDETMDRIRDVIADLRPPVLDDYGLTAGLHWYARHMADRAQMTIALHADECVPRLPADVETALFRITQEAVTNVIKHAGVSIVMITFRVDERAARLTISDNGAGFDHSARPPTERTSLGLVGMYERADAVQGSLQIKSAPGQGTHISIEVPRRFDHD